MIPLRPPISVVVPVYRGGTAFGRCLTALARLSPPPDEVVVVADGAHPADVAAAVDAGARVLQHEPARGPAYARNRGAEAATSDLLFFVDADCEVQPDAVARVADLLGAPSGPAAVIGSYDDAPGAPGVLSQYRNLLHHYTHQTGAAEAQTFWGACGAIRREAFLDVGGFDEGFGPPSVEDIDLGYRLTDAGYRIRLDASLQVKHLKRWRPADVLKTDLARRAYPWSRMLLRRGGLPDDLNTGRRGQASVALAGVAALSAVLAPAVSSARWTGAASLAGLTSLAGIGALNAPFYRFLAARRGAAFAARAFPWHVAYFLCAGAGYGAARAAHAFDATAARRASPVLPEPSLSPSF